MQIGNTINTQSTNNTYFHIVPNIYDNIDLCIKWNIKEFISSGSVTGFIAQHMKINSNISAVKNNDYWECWHIKNGLLEDRRDDYDDKWSPIFAAAVMMCENEIIDSKDGHICYSAQVYWIPDSTEEYNIISQWKPILGSPAGDLSMSYEFDYDVSKFFKCNRFYEWNYKEELKKIKKQTRKKMWEEL